MKKLIIILGVSGTAFSAILVRFADAPSVVLAFYRMFFSVLLISPAIVVSFKNGLGKIKAKEILMCALSGIFLGMHFVCYFESLKYTGIASSVVLVDTEVFFVAVGGILLFREKPSVAGILITFAGSVIVALGDAGSNGLFGDMLALCGAMCSAVYTLVGRSCRKNMSTTVYTWLVYFFAGTVVLLTSFISGESVGACSTKSLIAALGLAVMCTLLGHSVFSWGLKYEKASFISTVKLLEPVFAAILGLLIFVEIPSISSIIGGIIIIIGIIICIQTGKDN